MTWPQPLETVTGPFSPARISGAAEGMGDHGVATRSLIADGIVPPDLICGMTLLLLARQSGPEPGAAAKPGPSESADPAQPGEPAKPGDPERASAVEAKASPIAGGVWVREQYSMHRPFACDDAFTVAGESTGRFVKKGRRYGITRSQSHDSSGRLIATNLTNGLLSYKAEDGARDQVEGAPLDQTPGPTPDHEAARDNPHIDLIRAAKTGQRFGGDEVTVSLAMMAARDTSNPDNPIHSDLEAARRAGLAKPIAGGSHVLAFVIEPLLAAWGLTSLHYGSRFDVRWRAPTEADDIIVPTATVVQVAPDRVVVDLDVTLERGPTALVGTLTVPLPR